MLAWLIAVVAMQAPTAWADLPNHCLHTDIVGTWALYMSEPVYNKHTAFSACVKEWTPAQVVAVRLSDPEAEGPIAVAPGLSPGFWTMIYDEGFEIELGNKKFFAFSRYEYKESVFAVFSAWTGREAVSQCNATLPGTYHDKGVGGSGSWGCMLAKKLPVNAASSPDLEKISSAPPLTRDDFRVPIAHNSRRKDNYDSDRNNEGHLTMLFQTNEGVFVDHINSQQSSWKAGVYDSDTMRDLYKMYLSGGPAKVMPSRNFDDSLSPQALLATANGVDMMNDPALEQANNIQATAEVSIASQTSASAYGLPESFDWRNVSGVNYMTPVKRQDDKDRGYGCGSCYAVAMNAMFESRIRIHSHNALRPNLSDMDIVACSPYSQGCDGGFPYLVGKHYEDFGVSEEECVPYDLSQYHAIAPSISDYLLGDTAVCEKVSKCSSYEQRKWYGTNYHEIGGYYGASNELEMMREVVRDGPITIGFWASQDLIYYRGGIWHHVAQPEIVKHNGKLAWEKTNHAAVVVGYGTEAGESYWIAKNSWGDTWGEDGYFRIRRGTDEGGFESMASAVMPVLDSKLAASAQKSGAKSAMLQSSPSANESAQVKTPEAVAVADSTKASLVPKVAEEKVTDTKVNLAAAPSANQNETPIADKVVQVLKETFFGQNSDLAAIH